VSAMSSLCWKCRYYDSQVKFTVAPERPEWEDICESAGEYQAGEGVTVCAGYAEEKQGEKA